MSESITYGIKEYKHNTIIVELDQKSRDKLQQKT